jgi:TonB-linked SusC/RagA family outer membrane protein
MFNLSLYPGIYYDTSIISGRVLGIDHVALPGVNIFLKGTTIGTTSDSNGDFSITVDDPDEVLIFSFIGFKTLEVKAGSRSEMEIILTEDVTSLREVVVNAGYWNTTDREMTGSISRLTSSEIRKQPVSNTLLTMQGRMPGVLVTQTTGVPGGGVKVQIRGNNSLINGSEPMYIVDGVPFTSSTLMSQYYATPIGVANPLSVLNPNDIESIEVLKDADATAIYGSRGANGVILITTKKTSDGTTKFDFTFSTGISSVGKFLELIDTESYVKMRKEAIRNDGGEPTPGNAFDLFAWDSTRRTNWQKKLIGGAARSLTLNGTISGGNKNTRFLIGTSYFRDGTVFPGNSEYKKSNVNFQISNKSLNDKLEILLNAAHQLENNRLPADDFTSKISSLPPNSPNIYDTAGNLNWGPVYFENPFARLLRENTVKTTNLITNSRLQYSVSKQIRFKANLGYNEMVTEGYLSIPSASVNPYFGYQTGQAFFSYGKMRSWIVEPQLDYNSRFFGGQLNVIIGSTFQESSRNSNTIHVTGYSNDLLIKNRQAGSSIQVVENDESVYRYNGVFFHIGYVLDGKYIINLNGRRDGSSRFGPGKQFANFGAIGIGWIFSDEKSISENLTFLSFGKIKASYGITGNDQIGDYGFLSSYNTATYSYQNVVPLIPARLANPEFSWETNRKFEVGLDLGIFNDILRASCSYYMNRSSNQLVGLPLSGVSGFYSVQANLPAIVQNDGLEMSLTSQNINRNDFTWTSSFNMTMPRNELIKFSDIEKSIYYNTYIVGKPTSIAKVYEYNGINSNSGVYQFKDVDGDGAITTNNDAKTVINLNPTLYGGLQNSFRYKNWQVDMFIHFVKQTARNYVGYFGMPGSFGAQPEKVMNRWNTNEKQYDVQKFSDSYGSEAYNAYTNAQYSSLAYGDASFIRLKNISITYQFSTGVAESVKLTHAKIFIQAQNLFTITDFDGLDPENASYTQLPPLRTVLAGFQIAF